MDSLDEAAQRDVIRLYALSGQQSAALRQYEESVRILDEELGVPPEEETLQLQQAIRDREFPPLAESREILPVDILAETAEPSPFEERESNVEKLQTAPQHPPLVSLASATPAEQATKKSTPTHNLPSSTIPFVGREHELNDITTKLLDPACRLLTLVGPGGMGKTRLALAAAGRLLDSLTSESPTSNDLGSDGIYFVPLAAVEETDNIITAIADAVGYTFTGERAPQAQLFDYLQNKNMLLMLDNFGASVGWC